MSRDKQIEEMAKDMCEYYYEGTCYQDKKPCDCKCEIFTDAQYLYSKGYRKSTDVAEEIFAEIEKKIDLELSIIQKIIHAKGGRANGKTVLLGKIQTLIDSKNFIAELKKKYESEKNNEI